MRAVFKPKVRLVARASHLQASHGWAFVLMLCFLAQIAGCFRADRPTICQSKVRITESGVLRNAAISENEDSSMVAQDETKNGSCPFSMAFRTQKIDLSTVKRTKKEGILSTIPLVGDIQKSMARSKLNQQYASSIRWFDGQLGVHALASLWRTAEAFTRQGEDAGESVCVLAFPDSDPSLLQHWVEMIHWIQEQGDWEIPFRVRPLWNEEQTIPAMELSRQPSAPSTLVVNHEENLQYDASVIQKRMESWVKRILVEQGICPFTKSTKKSGQGLGDLGVPVARIEYITSNASTNQILKLMADTWESIRDMVEAGPSGKNGVSSILLSAPAFDDDFPLWAGPVFCLLEAGVMAAGAEPDIGVVCFHPRYATPDGTSWPGFGHMHSVPRLQKWWNEYGTDAADPFQVQNRLTATDIAAGGAWQRRTPHATINVLRADQLMTAESRRESGSLYAENIRKLVGKPDGIGSTQLQQDLDRERQLK